MPQVTKNVRYRNGKPHEDAKVRSAIASGTALASGTPGSARLKTAQNGAASTVIVEIDAGVGSGSLNFNSAIVSGGTVSITSATLTEGNA